MLDIVISNKCKKDLRRAKKRGLDLNDFFAVVEEGYSGVVLKTWGVKVVVAVCSGGSSSSGGLLRRRPGACPGVMRGAVEGGGARGPAVTVCPSRLRVRRVGRRGRPGRRREMLRRPVPASPR